MKTETDTYIQWKLDHYDQDLMKSYYICYTPARKNTQTNSIPPSLQNPPFLGSPLPFSNFSIPPPFFGFLVRSIHPSLPLKRQGSSNYGKSYLKLVSTAICQICIFLPNTSPLKTVKNVFYFIQKALFILEIFKFL